MLFEKKVERFSNNNSCLRKIRQISQIMLVILENRRKILKLDPQFENNKFYNSIKSKWIKQITQAGSRNFQLGYL